MDENLENSKKQKKKHVDETRKKADRPRKNDEKKWNQEIPKHE